MMLQSILRVTLKHLRAWGSHTLHVSLPEGRHLQILEHWLSKWLPLETQHQASGASYVKT